MNLIHNCTLLQLSWVISHRIFCNINTKYKTLIMQWSDILSSFAHYMSTRFRFRAGDRHLKLAVLLVRVVAAIQGQYNTASIFILLKLHFVYKCNALWYAIIFTTCICNIPAVIFIMLLTYLFVKPFHSQGFIYCIDIIFNAVIYMPFVDCSVIVDVLITV